MHSTKHKQKTSQLHRLVVLSFLASLVAYFVKNWLSYLLSHHTDTELYGTFYVTYRTIRALAMVFLIGSGTSVIRYIPRYLKTHKRARLINYLRWTYIRLGIFFLCYYVVLGATDAILHSIHPHQRNHFIINCLYLVPFLSLSYLWCALLKANGYRLIGMLAKYVLRYGSASLLILIIVYFLSGKINYGTGEMVAILSVLITTVGSWLLFKRLTPGFPSLMQCLFSRSNPPKQSWARNARTYFLNRSAFMTTNTITFYIVLLAAQDSNTIAYYAFITTLISVFRLLSEAIAVNLGSRVQVLFKQNIHHLKHEVANTNLALLMTQLVFTLLFVFFSEQIGSLFGKHFDTPLVYQGALILIIGFFLESFARTSVSLLMYTHYQKQLANQNLVTMAYIILVGVPATYFYGLLGICIVFATKQLVNGMINIYWVKKYLGFSPLIYLSRQRG